MTATKLAWTKTGGEDYSRSIAYTASAGGFEIHRSRIAGEWQLPALYRHGKFLRGCRKVAEAKAHAQHVWASEGESLINIL